VLDLPRLLTPGAGRALPVLALDRRLQDHCCKVAGHGIGERVLQHEDAPVEWSTTIARGAIG